LEVGCSGPSKHTFEPRAPYDPKPVWQNFRGPFRAIEEGNAGLNGTVSIGSLLKLVPLVLLMPEEMFPLAAYSIA
jgi:hypothetical protein